jgi:peptidoglycan/xylan/chitin deacetylase (PgdA/CDA1 family)
VKRLSALSLGVAATPAALAFAQLLPATTSLRRLRNLAWPNLAGAGRPGHVALTFDDGPDPCSTPRFLEALEELGWKATFFMLGEMAAASPDLVAEVARRGHEVAVHGYRHTNHLRRGPAWATRDMIAARELLWAATGARPLWARPPYGALAGSTLLAAWRAGLRPVLWTTWGRDWEQGATPASVASAVMATMVPGACVLLHDSDCTSAPGSWKATLAALPLLAERWGSLGLEVGPLRAHGLGN